MNLPTVINQSDELQGVGRPVRADQRGADDERLSFARIVAILRRRYGLIGGVAVALIAIGVVLTILQPRIYEAGAVVLLAGSEQQLQDKIADKTDNRQPGGDTTVASQIAVIGSRELAREVVRTEQLVDNRRFNPLLSGSPSLLDRLSGVQSKPINQARLQAPQRKAQEDALVDKLANGMTAYRVGNSMAVRIDYRDRDPELAARVANAFAREYIASQTKEQRAANSDAIGFLESKVAQLRSQATSDFAAVQNYRIRNGLLSTTGTTLTEQDISVYNQQSAAAKAEAAADQARLNTARRQLSGGSSGDDVGEALSSSVVSSLRAQRAAVGARVADLKARFGPRHPDLVSAQSELASVDRQIQDEIDRVISNLEAKAAVSVQRLSSLNGTLGAAKGELARNNGAMVSLDDLQRRAAASQSLYESYLARYREISASSGTERPESKLLNDAAIPQFPASPNVVLNLLLATLGGLMLGLVAAFVVEMQFRGLTTAQDVEWRTGLPFVGLSPHNQSIDPHGRTPLQTVATMPDSLLTEAMRGIYTVTRLPPSGRGRVLAVTSAMPGEGKTTLAAMLGEVARHSGERVVMVDCDVIQRGLSRLSELTSGPGLLEVIEQKVTLDEALREYHDGKMSILPITAKSRPGERLTRTGAFVTLLAELRDRFDLVILDCPPLLVLSESAELAGAADGVLLATKWRSTPYDAVKSAARLLPPRLTNFTGVVLSLVDVRKLAKYSYGEGTSYYGAYTDYVATA